jgi:hypothetical protein
MGVEVVASHALEQADRQQRVPAEREEVVVAADPRPVEQLGPDPDVPWQGRGCTSGCSPGDAQRSSGSANG